MADFEVRKLAFGEVKHSSHLLARAFSNNPVMLAILGGSEPERLRILDKLGPPMLGEYMKRGHVYSAHVEGIARCVMLTVDSGRYPLSLASELSFGFTVLWHGGIGVLRRFAIADKFIKTHHLTRPHRYIYMLGTDPDFQGQGLASALLAHLARELSGAESYLETDSPRTLAFYERNGFRVIGQETVPLKERSFPIWFLSATS